MLGGIIHSTQFTCGWVVWAMRWLWVINAHPIRRRFIMVTSFRFRPEFRYIWIWFFIEFSFMFCFSQCFSIRSWKRVVFDFFQYIMCSYLGLYFSRSGHIINFWIYFFIIIYFTMLRYPFEENIYSFFARYIYIFSLISIDTSVGFVEFWMPIRQLSKLLSTK